MRLLLDTHILIWAMTSPRRLDQETTEVLTDYANTVLFSAVSIWEIAIKAALGRPDFTVRPAAIVTAAREAGLTELPLDADVAARVSELPLHHRDPFDRLLIAQAMSQPVRFYTADAVLAAYSELVRVVAH